MTMMGKAKSAVAHPGAERGKRGIVSNQINNTEECQRLYSGQETIQNGYICISRLAGDGRSEAY